MKDKFSFNEPLGKTLFFHSVATENEKVLILNHFRNISENYILKMKNILYKCISSC